MRYWLHIYIELIIFPFFVYFIIALLCKAMLLLFNYASALLILIKPTVFHIIPEHVTDANDLWSKQCKPCLYIQVNVAHETSVFYLTKALWEYT